MIPNKYTNCKTACVERFMHLWTLQKRLMSLCSNRVDTHFHVRIREKQTLTFKILTPLSNWVVRFYLQLSAGYNGRLYGSDFFLICCVWHALHVLYRFWLQRKKFVHFFSMPIRCKLNKQKKNSSLIFCIRYIRTFSIFNVFFVSHFVTSILLTCKTFQRNKITMCSKCERRYRNPCQSTIFADIDELRIVFFLPSVNEQRCHVFTFWSELIKILFSWSFRPPI